MTGSARDVWDPSSLEVVVNETPTSPVPERSPHRDVSAQVKGLLPTLVLSIITPLVVFNVLKSHGASDFAAYLWASVGPLVETVGMAAIKREADKVAMLILGVTVVSAVLTAVGDTSPTMLLLKDSAVTGAFGVICLATLLPFAPRPLMFYFAQKFGTGGDDAGMYRFEGMWQAYPGFRRSFRVMTLAWGLAYVLGELPEQPAELLGLTA